MEDFWAVVYLVLLGTAAIAFASMIVTSGAWLLSAIGAVITQ